MSAFAALLVRHDDKWFGAELDVRPCESVADVAELAVDFDGSDAYPRLVMIEEDDEYAAIVRLDAEDDEPRAFLSDGHAADSYRTAAVIAEGLPEVGGDELADDADAPPAHDAAPFGDPEVVADLGTSSQTLLALCAHEGTLPVDMLCAICENAGCGELFDDLRV